MIEDPVFWMVAVAVALPVWATLRIVRSDLPKQRKITSLVGAWVMPFIGPIAMLIEVPRRGRPAKVSPTAAIAIDAPPADALELPGREPFVVSDHLMDGNGFPILDWHALDQWAKPDADPAVARAAVDAGRRAWLASMRDTLAGTHLLESPDAWVLSSYEPRLAQTVSEYVSTARRRIARVLDGVAMFPPGERTIFVALESLQAYYQYVANYYPEDGEFSFSGGMYVNHGCPHFVTVKDELWRLEPVIAHELTHSALAHLRLPLWLDEGIAVTTEDHVASKYTRPHRDHLEKLGKHLNFWNAERMQEFWTGESFGRTDEGHTLSYDLAHNIVGLLGREWRSFTAFATNAKRADAGAAAARDALGLDLGELAAAALNVKPQAGWSPDPAAWKKTPRQR